MKLESINPEMATELQPIRAGATRLRIVRAAEKLYGERGIDGVSLQEIVRAAEQRHRSVVQYHFGDKAGLLEAILDRHAVGVAEARNRLLDEIESDGSQHSTRRLAAAYVLPVAEEAEHADGGIDFVRISAELIGHPEYSQLYLHRADEIVASRRLMDHVEAANPDLPPAFRLPRAMLTAGLVFHGIADWSNATTGASARRHAEEWSALIKTLVEAVAALWSLRSWESEPAG